MADYLEAQEPSEEKVDITTDGACFSKENKEKAAEKNIELHPTALS